MSIPIHNSTKVATDFRSTSTGPEALIEGKWFSVNGTRGLIWEIRFEVKQADPLSRPVLLHICADGTVTHRTRHQRIFNGVALPFFSVENEEEAKALTIILCAKQYKSHPLLPSEPWYVFPGFAGEIEDIDRVTAKFQEVYAKL